MHPSTGQTPPSTLLNPLITHLLAIPMLPSTIPIPALTYLSNTLALFPMLLPYAAAHPDIITGIPCTQSALRLPHNNPLASEHGKTYLLANLVTFGITGQMLVHASVQGKKAWMSVLTQILSGLDEGWGRWVEGVVDEDEDVRMTGDGADSDDSDLEDTPPVRLGPTGSSGAPQAGPSIISPTKSRPRQTRPLLPLKTSSKLLLLPSPAHMGLLIDMIVSPSAKAGTADLLALVNMAGELMRLFRGTPKWEAILDALSSGRNGKQLFRRLWRECVRGRWGASGLQVTWEGFASSESLPF
jgi:ubiquitin-protein ligase E3 C